MGGTKETNVISTKIGPNNFILSIRSYKLTQPSGVLGLIIIRQSQRNQFQNRFYSAMGKRGETNGKNSRDHQGLPSRSAFLILSLILTIDSFLWVCKEIGERFDEEEFKDLVVGKEREWQSCIWERMCSCFGCCL